MIARSAQLGRKTALTMFADWTDRIAAGEVPPVPPRPEGIERNLVLTLWEWGGPATFAHDELSTDKRNPTANANGPIYGVDWGNDGFLTLDPNTHTATEVRIPVLDPTRAAGQTPGHAEAVAVLGQRALLVRSCHHEPCRDGQQRARLDVVAFSPARESAGFLRRPSVGDARAAADELPAGAVLRPADEAVSSRSTSASTLTTCSSRQRCRRNALRQRRLQRRDRLGQHSGPRGNGRRGRGARLVHAVFRSERRRQDRSRCGPLCVRALAGSPEACSRVLQVPKAIFYSVIAHPTDGSIWGAVPGPDAGAHRAHRPEDLRLRRSTSRRSTIQRSTSTATRRAASTSTPTA